MSHEPHAWYLAALRIAIIAGVFSALVAALLAANGLRSLRVSALLDGEITTMKAELRKTPDDAALKERLRQVDLQYRAEFFRRRAVAQYGAFLLLGGLALFLLAAKFAKQYRFRAPRPEGEVPDQRPIAARGRYAVALAGVMFAGVLAGFAVVARQEISAEYPVTVAAVSPSLQGNNPPPDNGTTGQSPVNAASTAVNLTLTGQPTNGTAQQPADGQTPTLDGTPPPAVDAAKQWPVFRGVGGNGVARGADYPSSWDGAKGTNILWKTGVPLPGENSPVVWGDAVFLAGADEHQREVYCFDANTGKLRWKQPVTDLSCADKSPLEVMEDTGYTAPTMATDGAHVAVMFANGDLACFDFTGKRLWAKNMGKPDNMYGHATSLTVHKNRLILQFDQGSSAEDDKSALLALDMATGRQAWRTRRELPASWSTPIVIRAGGREELITCGNPWVIAYNPENGKELWRAEVLGGDVAPSPVFAGGLVFAVNSGSNLAAIRPGGNGDVTKTHVAWTFTEDLPDIVSPLSNGEIVLTAYTYGTLTCVDAKTGKLLWSQDFDADFKSSPTLVGDRIYLLDAKGVMHIFAAGRAYKELGKAALGEPAHASPAFVDGRIYIRGKHNLYCIGKKG